MASIIANNGEDSLLEDFIDTSHLLATTFHVEGTHLLCDGFSLLLGNRCKTLSFEHLNAGLFRSEIRL